MQLKMAPFSSLHTEPLYQFYDGYITRTSGGGEEVEGEEGVEHTYESLQDTTSIRWDSWAAWPEMEVTEIILGTSLETLSAFE